MNDLNEKSVTLARAIHQRFYETAPDGFGGKTSFSMRPVTLAEGVTELELIVVDRACKDCSVQSVWTQINRDDAICLRAILDRYIEETTPEKP